MDRYPGLTVKIVLLAGLACACAVPRTPAPQRPSLRGEGSVWVYEVRTARAASMPRIDVSAVAALSDTGEQFPLTVPPDRSAKTKAPRDRLVAWGALPPGSYTALQLERNRTSNRDTGEQREPGSPAEPVEVDVGFTLRRGQARVVWLEWSEPPMGDAADAVLIASNATQSASGLTAVATCRGAGAVWLYDKLSGRTFDVVPVGSGPSAVAIGPTPLRAWVTLAGDSALAVLELAERVVVERVPLGAGDSPEHLAFTPDRSLVVTANTGSGTVSVIDVSAYAEVDRVRVGDYPRNVRIGRDGRRAFVLNSGSDTISVVDLSRRVVVATLSTEAEPMWAEFGRDHDRLYVIHRASPHLLVIDVATLSILQRVYIGLGASALAVDPLSGRILVAREGTFMVEVFDPSSLLPLDFIPVDGDVLDLVIDPEGNHLHAVASRGDTIGVFRLSNRKPLNVVDVGPQPSRVAIAGVR